MGKIPNLIKNLTVMMMLLAAESYAVDLLQKSPAALLLGNKKINPKGLTMEDIEKMKGRRHPSSKKKKSKKEESAEDTDEETEEEEQPEPEIENKEEDVEKEK